MSDAQGQTLKMFAVYDHAVGAYLQPFFMRSSGEAIRAFTDTVNDPSTLFNRHPKDYTLFRIGWFDVEHGGLLAPSSPEPVLKAIEVIREPEMTLPFGDDEHSRKIWENARTLAQMDAEKGEK